MLNAFQCSILRSLLQVQFSDKMTVRLSLACRIFLGINICGRKREVAGLGSGRSGAAVQTHGSLNRVYWKECLSCPEFGWIGLDLILLSLSFIGCGWSSKGSQGKLWSSSQMKVVYWQHSRHLKGNLDSSSLCPPQNSSLSTCNLFLPHTFLFGGLLQKYTKYFIFMASTKVIQHFKQNISHTKLLIHPP